MILGNDIARTLFQAPFMMAATKVRMLGNEATDEVLRENVVIQKKMVASFIIGCHSVLRALADILAKMKKEQEANE